VRLIISVDTGIRAFAAAETARRTGVDLMSPTITCRHRRLPHALAVVIQIKTVATIPASICAAGRGLQVGAGLMQRRLDTKDQSRLLMSFMKVVPSPPSPMQSPCWARIACSRSWDCRAAASGQRRPEALLEVAKLGDGRR